VETLKITRKALIPLST